jgi:hypothetical protein
MTNNNQYELEQILIEHLVRLEQLQIAENFFRGISRFIYGKNDYHDYETLKEICGPGLQAIYMQKNYRYQAILGLNALSNFQLDKAKIAARKLAIEQLVGGENMIGVVDMILDRNDATRDFIIKKKRELKRQQTKHLDQVVNLKCNEIRDKIEKLRQLEELADTLRGEIAAEYLTSPDEREREQGKQFT